MKQSQVGQQQQQHERPGEKLKLGSVIHVNPSDDWDTPQIISPPITLALAVFTSGVAALLLWSVTYRLPIAATSKGLLYQGPRLSSVTAKTDGRIVNIRVNVGDKVNKGQQLARLDLDDDQVKLQSAKTQRQLALQNQAIASTLIPGELKEQLKAYRKSLDGADKYLAAQTKILEKKVKNIHDYRALVSKGFISDVEFIEYEQAIVDMENEIEKLRSEQNKLLAERESTRRKLVTLLNSSRTDFSQAQETEQLRTNRLKAANDLVSPIDGTVVQIIKRSGQAVSEGLELFVISPNNAEGLKGAFLVSGDDAGKIKVGDRALISPSSAPPQRFGYVQGVVKLISPYPSNTSAVARYVGSETLAEGIFTSQESKIPLLVVVEPQYKNNRLVWVGSKGPEWKIRSGILADVKIIYKERLPISYVLPWIKNVTGLDNF